jgi:hypothetical protein
MHCFIIVIKTILLPSIKYYNLTLIQLDCGLQNTVGSLRICIWESEFQVPAKKLIKSIRMEPLCKLGTSYIELINL